MSLGNAPDKGYNIAEATLNGPTYRDQSPGFRSGTGNFNPFSTDYGATADIYHHGGRATGLGTRVILQIGHSVNADTSRFPVKAGAFTSNR